MPLPQIKMAVDLVRGARRPVSPPLPTQQMFTVSYISVEAYYFLRVLVYLCVHITNSVMSQNMKHTPYTIGSTMPNLPCSQWFSCCPWIHFSAIQIVISQQLFQPKLCMQSTNRSLLYLTIMGILGNLYHEFPCCVTSSRRMRFLDNLRKKVPVLVAMRSKAQVCSHSPAEIMGSNTTGGTDFCYECCV